MLPEAGVQVFLWGSPAAERDLKLAKDAGFTWVKQMFQWDLTQRQISVDPGVRFRQAFRTSDRQARLEIIRSRAFVEERGAGLVRVEP